MDLEYKIKTSAELAGAEAAADALERQIGKAKALKQDYSELQKQLDTMRESITEAKVELDKSTEVLEQTGIATKDFIPYVNGAEKAVDGFSFKGREMHHIIGELNRSVPGLGFALKGLLTDAGPMIVAVLAIQAAMEYWNLAQEEAKAKAEALAAAMDKIRTALHDAVEEQGNYSEAMKKAADDGDAYRIELESQTAVLDAQYNSKKKLIDLDKQSELARAQTPAEKQAVKEKYGAIEAGMASDEEQAKIDLTKSIIKQLKGDISDRSGKIADIDSGYQDAVQRDQWLKSIGQGADGKGRQEIAGEMAELTKQRKALDDANVAAQERITELTTKVNSATDVHFINDDERLRASNRTISRGVESIDDGRQSGQVTPDMREANQALTDLFAKYNGGISAMVAIVKNHAAHSTSQDQEIAALKNAIATLQQRANQNSAAIDTH